MDMSPHSKRISRSTTAESSRPRPWERSGESRSTEDTPLLRSSSTDTASGPQTGAREGDAPSHVDYSKIFTDFIQRCFPCPNTRSSTPELGVSEEPSPVDIQQGSERSGQRVDALEQRLWNSLKRDTSKNFKLRMTEICNEETPEIVYRVKLFSHLDEKLRTLKSRLEDQVREEVKHRLSEEKKSIMDNFFETKQKLQDKQSEMFENEQYQYLKDKYDERDRMQNKLTKDQSELENLRTELENARTELSKMQNINVDPAIGESSRDGRRRNASRSHLASKIKWYPGRIATLEQGITTLETRVQPLEQEIATLETRVQPFQTAYNEIEAKFSKLQTEVNKIKDEVKGEVEKILEQDADIQKLKEERRDAQRKMQLVADNAKKQIRANAEQQYNHFLTNRLRMLGEKLIGTSLSKEEQEKFKFKTREIPIEVPIAEEEHKVSEFIAFATALEDKHDRFTKMHSQGLEVIGGKFRDRHKRRLINALDNTANSLKEALSSEDKQTLEMALKVCQGEALSQDEKQTLETTLIKTRQGEALSQDEKSNLKIVQKIRQGEALSQDEKQTLEHSLMKSLKHRSSTATPGHKAFIMGAHGAPPKWSIRDYLTSK